MPRITETDFVILDTETTGADTEKDKPIEIALIHWQNFEMSEPKSWLIDPGVPIPPGASAVHHLVDEDLVGKPRIEEIWDEVCEFAGPGSVLMAHNAKFDLGMLPLWAERQHLCTLRLAKRLWPKGSKNNKGMPLCSHQQQEIRYWLGLRIDTGNLAAHRAAADIIVTGKIFTEAVRAYLDCGGEDDIDSLLELIASPISMDTMPFGKFAGQRLSAIKSDYFEWLLQKSETNPIDEDLKASVKRELDIRKAEIIVATRN